MLEINANTMRHDHVLRGIEGTKIISVGHHKKISSKRTTFKDTIHNTFSLFLDLGYSLSKE